MNLEDRIELSRNTSVPEDTVALLNQFVDFLTKEIVYQNCNPHISNANTLASYVARQPWRKTQLVQDLGLTCLEPDMVLSECADKDLDVTVTTRSDMYALVLHYAGGVVLFDRVPKSVTREDLEVLCLVTHGLDASRMKFDGIYDTIENVCYNERWHKWKQFSKINVTTDPDQAHHYVRGSVLAGINGLTGSIGGGYSLTNLCRLIAHSTHISGLPNDLYQTALDHLGINSKK